MEEGLVIRRGQAASLLALGRPGEHRHVGSLLVSGSCSWGAEEAEVDSDFDWKLRTQVMRELA